MYIKSKTSICLKQKDVKKKYERCGQKYINLEVIIFYRNSSLTRGLARGSVTGGCYCQLFITFELYSKTHCEIKENNIQ